MAFPHCHQAIHWGGLDSDTEHLLQMTTANKRLREHQPRRHLLAIHPSPNPSYNTHTTIPLIMKNVAQAMNSTSNVSSPKSRFRHTTKPYLRHRTKHYRSGLCVCTPSLNSLLGV